jgi:uncharacterized protein (DUF952 family)
VLIYKILLPAEWAAFEASGASGVFVGSPLDRRDGFVHLSTREQVAGTVERHFAGEPELVVLAVEADPLREWLRWEGSFPHLYAPLARSAVAAVHRHPLG